MRNIFKEKEFWSGVKEGLFAIILLFSAIGVAIIFYLLGLYIISLLDSELLKIIAYVVINGVGIAIGLFISYIIYFYFKDRVF